MYLDVASAERTRGRITVAHRDTERIAVFAGLCVIAHAHLESEGSGVIYFCGPPDIGAVAANDDIGDIGAFHLPIGRMVIVSEISAWRSGVIRFGS